MNPVVTIIDFGRDTVLSSTPAFAVTNVKDIMQLPINCVVIGDQPEEKKSRFITDFRGVLKNIFSE